MEKFIFCVVRSQEKEVGSLFFIQSKNIMGKTIDPFFTMDEKR